MLKRLAFVGVLAGAFLLLLAGVALAEDRVLDQTVCEDGATWGNSSQITGGVWNGITSSCGASSVDINAGDSLTIPTGTRLTAINSFELDGTLTNNGSLQGNADYLRVNDGGVLINTGAVVDNIGVAVALGGSFQNNAGSVTAGSIEVHGSWTGAGTTGGVEVRVWGSMTNTGTLNATDMWVWGTVLNQASATVFDSLWVYGTFTNACGATFSAGTIEQGSVTDEPCSSTTTTMPATTTTAAAPTTTAAAPTTTVAVAPTSETLPFTGLNDDRLPLGYVGILSVVGGAAVLLATAVRGRKEEQ